MSMICCMIVDIKITNNRVININLKTRWYILLLLYFVDQETCMVLTRFPTRILVEVSKMHKHLN